MHTRFFLPLLMAGLLGLFFASCQSDDGDVLATRNAGRPNSPWVFRSVLDQQPRMVTFALNDHLWVAYSIDSCSLYKAWSGSVAFEGAVYNMRHGPQPTSVGNGWFENKHRQPWSVTLNGQTQQPRPDYKGHRYTKDGHAEIMYDLVLSDGQRIRINERPEYVEQDQQRGFERSYTVENAPAGAIVTLRTNVGSITDPVNIQTNGQWKAITTTPTAAGRSLSAIAVDGELTLRNDESTRFTTMFVSMPLVANANAAVLADGESPSLSSGEKIMAKSDCRTCHNEQVKTVGPAYVSIAERYKNIPENIEKLAKKIMVGGSGVWGIAAMSAHPDLQPEDAKAMVSYVLSLDKDKDDGEGREGAATKSLASIPMEQWLKPDDAVSDREMIPGLIVKLFQSTTPLNTLNTIDFNAAPIFNAVVGNIDVGGGDFGPFKDNFAFVATGYLFLEKDDNVVIQLSSDDGSRLYLDGQRLIDNDGPHGMEPKEAEIALRSGYHALRLEYFQGGGGRGISLQWARYDDSEFKPIPESNFVHKNSDTPVGASTLSGGNATLPGDGAALTEVHPAYDLSQARPDEFLPKVSGMDFLPDGRLLVTVWDASGALYALENVNSGDPKKIKLQKIAEGLAEPLGIKVVDGDIYVLQKQELTKLVDNNKDGVIDEYQCFAKGWRASANFHEFAFGLVYKDGHFYATLATAILPGGASARPQILDRGKAMKISKQDGSIEFIARGLRTPDGVGMGPDNEIFVADNQGDWLPASKLVHIKPGAFYGSFSVDSAAVAGMPIQQPVVWLPQDEIGNSPTQPAVLNDGPYKNQLIHGDVCYGGLQRVFMEKVNGDYQGTVFRFTQGLEGGTHRLAWGPDGALYIGCIGNPGNWSQEGKLWYGLQRMKYNGQSVFEMLAVRAKTNGVEIEFTEPLREGDGWDPTHYGVQQWWYKPTNQYGGPKMDQENLTVSSASVSADRKKVFLEIPGIKPGHLVYIRLQRLPISSLGHQLWTTETWYTMNAIPADAYGAKTDRPAYTPPADNTLTDQEKAEGWALLFDGASTKGWHNYGKQTIGPSWIVNDNALHLEAKPDPNGGWQAADGGDILTTEDYQDFELSLDWKIGACGNSGIIYNVVEDPAKYDYVWKTGPEMQVLDNTCHPDARIPKHRAGDLYDLIACKYETVKPAGEWNRARLISKNGKVEHWLNDHKLVTYDMNSPEWPKMIAASKFKDMPAFGKSNKGRIALQDHGNLVWFKNIKIRRL